MLSILLIVFTIFTTNYPLAKEGNIYNPADIHLSGNPTANISVGGSIPPIPAMPTGATINSLGDITQSGKPLVLPQWGDFASKTDVDGSTQTTYYYQINNWSERPIYIRDGTTAQIRIYISGNILQKGEDDLRMQTASATPNPGQIRVYGGFSDGSPPPGNNQNWVLSGNSCTMAFIHAPYADIGILRSCTYGDNGLVKVGVRSSEFGVRAKN